MAYWTIHIVHVPTNTIFEGGAYWFHEDEEDVSSLMIKERQRFLNAQENEERFMFNTDPGYAAIPPSILKDCMFSAYMCHMSREPIPYDH